MSWFFHGELLQHTRCTRLDPKVHHLPKYHGSSSYLTEVRPASTGTGPPSSTWRPLSCRGVGQRPQSLPRRETTAPCSGCPGCRLRRSGVSTRRARFEAARRSGAFGVYVQGRRPRRRLTKRVTLPRIVRCTCYLSLELLSELS